MLNELIRSEIRANPISMVGGALAMPTFNKVKKILDYTEYRGAPLLGVNGVVIIGHGRWNTVAVKNAIRERNTRLKPISSKLYAVESSAVD